MQQGTIPHPTPRSSLPRWAPAGGLLRAGPLGKRTAAPDTAPTSGEGALVLPKHCPSTECGRTSPPSPSPEDPCELFKSFFPLFPILMICF